MSRFNPYTRITFLVLIMIQLVMLAGCAEIGKYINLLMEKESTSQPKLIQPPPVVEAPPIKPLSSFEKRLHVLHFDDNQPRFTDKYWDELFIAAEELRKIQGSCIEIYSYMIPGSNYTANKELASMRAEWVTRCLIAEKIDPFFIRTVKVVEPQTSSSNSSREDLIHYNRIEIYVLQCIDIDRKKGNEQREVDPDNPFKYKQ